MDRARVIALILALILCASSGWARGLGVLGLGGGAAATSSFCAGRSGDILCEDFDGAGTPSGWTTSGSTFNFDNTTTEIDATEYFSADYTSSAGYVNIPITSSTEAFVACVYRPRAHPSSGTDIITSQSYVLFRTTSTGGVYGSAGVITGANGILSTNTVYYIKSYFKASTGASDGILKVWSSTDGSNWTERVSVANHGNTAAQTYIRLYTGSSNQYDIENIIVSSSDIDY